MWDLQGFMKNDLILPPRTFSLPQKLGRLRKKKLLLKKITGSNGIK